VGEEDNEGEVARSKIPDDGCRESDSVLGLFWGCNGAGVCVLGVLLGGAASGFGGAGVWGKKHTVNLYLTMGNYGNKIGFGGTDEILGGVGRSPLQEQSP